MIIADVHTGERQEEACAADQCGDGDQIGRPAEMQAHREGRHQRGGDPCRGEDQIRRDAEEPGGVVRKHDLLAQQPDNVAVGLQNWRTLAAKKSRLHFSYEAGEQRREQ